MAAVKRTLSKIRPGSTDDDDDDGFSDDWTTIPIADAESEDEGRDLPVAWLGLAAASLAGLGVAGYKLYQHRKAAKAERKEEPWRVEEDQRSPTDPGTSALVGLVFVNVVRAVVQRYGRPDPW